MVIPRPPPPKPMTTEEILVSSPQQVFAVITLLVRLGQASSLEPMIKCLLEQRRTAAGSTTIHSTAVLDMLGEDGHSLLHWAAKRVDDLAILQLLCKHVSPATLDIPSSDSVGMRPLHWACTEGSVPHIATLLNYGADMEGKDLSGCTPLLIAAQYGHVELVGYLLQKGANGHATDNMLDTALHWAAYKGSVQVCGLLLFRGELTWTTADSFGQTPLHLAALRGHTTTVRYLLSEGTLADGRTLLYLKDKNGKTPLDLAITKNRPTVQALLRDTMDAYELKPATRLWKQGKATLRQFFSYHSWQVWMGCTTSRLDEIDDAPKFPFYVVLFYLGLYLAWYMTVFTPLNHENGMLWDLMGWHSWNILGMLVLWYSLYKTFTTNPGTLDQSSPKTPELTRIYEQTIESYADESKFTENKVPLCHTCHIARPLRSKHCRVQRKCVLLFDHFCPFVGNTVGMHNYKWFYIFLLAMVLCYIGFFITFGIYMRRLDKFDTFLFLKACFTGLPAIPAIGMLIYHTQLSMVNLTTNEHQNLGRYPYLLNEHGQYKNPFFRGVVRNFLDRFSPTEALYTLPMPQHQEHLSLLDNSIV